ncbi:MAG: hypothetical protein ACRD0X_00130 [Thermoanaerobaculia bacterium]
MTGADASDEAGPGCVAALPTEPGLCASCRHAIVTRSRRSAFLRCAWAEVDPRFPRYPRLPVVDCDGYRRRNGEG